MPKIFVLTGPDVGRSCEVQAGALFGRADDCSVRLKDASVSRHHARLEHTDAGWSIVDLGSRNGVFWNGERVERVTLEEGREFTLGDVVLKFREAASAKPSPAAREPAIDEGEIVLEGTWDESKAVANPPLSATTFAPRTAAPAPEPPSIAHRRATEKLAAAGALPAPSKVGARGVLQYNKIESRSGFLQSDFDQQPLWIKFLILLAVLLVVAGVSWMAFRGVVLLRGAPEDPPAIEDVGEVK